MKAHETDRRDAKVRLHCAVWAAWVGEGMRTEAEKVAGLVNNGYREIDRLYEVGHLPEPARIESLEEA